MNQSVGLFRFFNRSSAKVVTSTLFVVLTLGLYFHHLWPTFQGFVQSIDFCNVPFCDFSVFYYEMGKEIFLTKAPAIGFGYSPFVAVFFGFFGLFPLDVSTNLWVFFLVGSMAALVIASLKLNASKEPEVFLPLFLLFFLTSFPVLHNFKWGQVGVLLTLLLVGAVLEGRKQHWITSSLFLALATSLKYYPALFLIPFVLRKQWRVVGGFAGWCLVLFLGIPSAFFGFSSTAAFLGQVAHIALGKQIAAGGPNSQFFVNVVMRWCSGLVRNPDAVRPVLRVVSFLILEGVVGLLILLARTGGKKFFEWSLVLLFLSIPFVVATSWPHYLVFLPVCQIFLASEVLERKGSGGLAPLWAGGLTLLSVFAGSIFLFEMMGSWERYTGAGFLLIADILLLISSLILLLPKIRMLPRLSAGNDTPVPMIAGTKQ